MGSSQTKQKELGQKLLEASTQGDLLQVKKIIEEHRINPNFTNYDNVCKF